MKKQLFTSLLTGAALFFSLNASAHYYLNVINHSQAGMLFKVAEESDHTVTNGITHFPEQSTPTTLIFSGKDSSKLYSSFTIGTIDGKSYCQVKVAGLDGYSSRLIKNNGFQCSFDRINDNTGNLVIEENA